MVYRFLILLPTFYLFVSNTVLAQSEPTDPQVKVYSSGRPVADVLQTLAQSANIRLTVAKDVTGTVDLSLNDVSLSTALNAICRANGLKWSVQDGVYVIEKGETPVAPPMPDTEKPASSKKLDFGQLEGKVEPAPEEKRPAEKAVQQEKPRELKLNPAQMRLVLEGVPNNKAKNLLEYWRNNSGFNQPRFYTPNGANSILNRPPVVWTPYGPYYPGFAPPSVIVYPPNGRVRNYPGQ